MSPFSTMTIRGIALYVQVLLDVHLRDKNMFFVTTVKKGEIAHKGWIVLKVYFKSRNNNCRPRKQGVNVSGLALQCFFVSTGHATLLPPEEQIKRPSSGTAQGPSGIRGQNNHHYHYLNIFIRLFILFYYLKGFKSPAPSQQWQLGVLHLFHYVFRCQVTFQNWTCFPVWWNDPTWTVCYLHGQW